MSGKFDFDSVKQIVSTGLRSKETIEPYRNNFTELIYLLVNTDYCKM